MQMIMKAKVAESTGADTTISEVGKVFKSSLPEMEGILTDRVCDERNSMLFEVFGSEYLGHSERFSKILPIETECFYVADLNEILSYNWDQMIAKIGYLTEKQYKIFKNDEFLPKNIRKSPIIGAKVANIMEMDMILMDESLRKADKYCVKIEYDPKPLREYCKFFCEESIPTLMKLVPEGGNYSDVFVKWEFRP